MQLQTKVIKGRCKVKDSNLCRGLFPSALSFPSVSRLLLKKTTTTHQPQTLDLESLTFLRKVEYIRRNRGVPPASPNLLCYRGA